MHLLEQEHERHLHQSQHESDNPSRTRNSHKSGRTTTIAPCSGLMPYLEKASPHPSMYGLVSSIKTLWTSAFVSKFLTESMRHVSLLRKENGPDLGKKTSGSWSISIVLRSALVTRVLLKTLSAASADGENFLMRFSSSDAT